MSEITTGTETKNRTEGTGMDVGVPLPETHQEQLRILRTFNFLSLFAEALHSMRCLADRGREMAEAAREAEAPHRLQLLAEADKIQSIQTAFLNAIVITEYGKVRSIPVKYELWPPRWCCPRCGRSWCGRNVQCGSCGAFGEQVDAGRSTIDEWFEVQVSEYSFLEPPIFVSAVLRSSTGDTGEEVELERKIPDLALTVTAQMACVRVMTVALLDCAEQMFGDFRLQADGDLTRRIRSAARLDVDADWFALE
jgi:hypothetical protein